MLGSSSRRLGGWNGLQLESEAVGPSQTHRTYRNGFAVHCTSCIRQEASPADKRPVQRVLNVLLRTRLSCGRMIWILPHPLPPSSQQVVSLSKSSFVSPVELMDGAGGASINHSILFGPASQVLVHFE